MTDTDRVLHSCTWKNTLYTLRIAVITLPDLKKDAKAEKAVYLINRPGVAGVHHY